MSKSKSEAAAAGADGTQGPPALRREAGGRVEPASLAAVIQWFLDYDERVAVVRFPAVEALFQWRRQEELKADEEPLGFNRAEDRLAVGVMQALVEHDTESALHGWITELLSALEDARQTNESIAEAYGLQPSEDSSVVREAEKIPSRRERDIYLNCCWLETLCTAEARVLGWAYRGLYGRAFHPENF